MLDYHIQTFLSVAKNLNYTRAAEELHITQPAVSQHIHYLEKLYNTRLFYQKGKKVFLTPAGELLRSTAMTLKNDELRMIEKMQRNSSKGASLVFGATMTIGEFVIPKALAAYSKKYPEVDLKMVIANTSELLERLHSGELHFALVEGSFTAEKYDHQLYSREAFIPVCASGHFFHKEPSMLRELTEETLLVRENGSGTRDILEKNLDLQNMQISDFSRRIETDSMYTILQLLLADCGISFLYEAAVKEQLADNRLRRLELSDFHMIHDFTFIWEKGSIFAEEYRQICKELQEMGQTMAV